jgi:hypothetical protein
MSHGEHRHRASCIVQDWTPHRFLIPCRSQADAIVRAIEKARIPYEGILIPDEGRLVDFHAAEMLFA